MERSKTMKKNSIIIMSLLALLMTASLPKANAQIFIIDEEEYLNSSRSRVTNGQLPIIPQLGSTQDQYAPLGGGVWILGCLGGVYLLGKRKNRREE